MKNFKPDSRSRDRRDFGGRDSRKPVLYDAVCDECGKNCQVPFRPSGDRSVYCSDCFEKRGGRDGNRLRDRRDYSRRSFGGRDSRKPSQNNISVRSISQLTEKIGVLNAKLGTIISLLSSAGDKKPKSIESKTKKSKKSTTKEADEVTKMLTSVKKKDTGGKELKQK